MGGLYTPLAAGAKIIVGFFVRPGFTAYMTKNLFLVSKFKDIKQQDDMLNTSKKVDVINTSKNDTENLEGGEEVLDTEREL